MRIPPRIPALALALLCAAPVQSAEILDPAQGPDHADSAMYTLEDLFDRLSTGAAGTLRGAAFVEPAAVAGEGDTGHTLNDIMGVAPAADNTNGATGGQVRAGKTFWGLRASGTWGLATGQMVDRGGMTITPSTAPQSIPAGYHDGSGKVEGDSNLTPEQIKKDVQIFGVTGTGEVATGNAVAADVLATKTFSNAGAVSVTGVMPDNGTVVITPGVSQQTIAAGYHSGSGEVVGDSDLAAANIAKDVVVFGTTGSTVVSRGNATVGQVLAGKTFSTLTAVGETGTMVDRGAMAIVPGTAAQAIPAGYHNGSGIAAGDADLAPANIPSGVDILGVTGAATLAAGNAAVGEVFSGETFSRTGVNNLTGTMADVSTDITPTGAEIAIPAGYHDGTRHVLTDANLAAANIRSGVDIYGVVGGADVADTASGDATAGDIAIGKIAWVDGVQLTGAQTRAHIAKTGQTVCYDKAGTVISCAGTGQDGEHQKGMDLPVARFTDNGGGTVTDNITGLIWMTNANCKGSKVLWQAALDFVNGINSGTYSSCRFGHTDWRLPNSTEMLSLMSYAVDGSPQLSDGHYFSGVANDKYWASTTLLGDPQNTGSESDYTSWVFDLGNGSWRAFDKLYDGTAYVWPVRGGR